MADRSPVPEPTWADHGVSALQALLGDYLVRSGNELAEPMAFFEGNAPVALPALPAAGPAPVKVCVLVHGLGCNESIWTYPGPSGPTDYGRELARIHGLVPAYVRYNTGLPVRENGQRLAALLARLARGRRVGELVLIGHSMGGLVIRAALAEAARRRLAWGRKVRRVVSIGSPHRGAPLARAVQALEGLLGWLPSTPVRVVRQLLGIRSAGIRDLGEDAPGAGPEPAQVTHYAIVGTVHADPGHPVNGFLGDVLVTPGSGASAPGIDARGDRVRVMPGLTHLRLAYDPAVLPVLAGWLA